MYQVITIKTMERNITKLFQYMCKNGHLEYAQWLYQIKPNLDVSIFNFQLACSRGHLKVAQWLYEIKPTLICIGEL